MGLFDKLKGKVDDLENQVETKMQEATNPLAAPETPAAPTADAPAAPAPEAPAADAPAQAAPAGGGVKKMVCASCGVTIAGPFTKCPNCGAPLTPPEKPDGAPEPPQGNPPEKPAGDPPTGPRPDGAPEPPTNA